MRSKSALSASFVACVALLVLSACAPKSNSEASGHSQSPLLTGSQNDQNLSTPPTVAQVSAAQIAESERARVGSLRFLHARGVAELRWSDAQGKHFEQGDADVRWCFGRGVAASISKFGDRHAWIGSDGVRWWRFELKTSPSRMVWGQLHAGGSTVQTMDAQAATPRFLGIAPLLPAAGARVQERDGLLWVELEREVHAANGASSCEAGFDPLSLAPRIVRLQWMQGVSTRVEFAELMSVQTDGIAPGAWPRIPRRIFAAREGETAALSISIDSAVADQESVDRPALFDMDGLRARFSPEVTEVQP